MHKGAAMYSDFGVISTCYNVQNNTKFKYASKCLGGGCSKAIKVVTQGT